MGTKTHTQHVFIPSIKGIKRTQTITATIPAQEKKIKKAKAKKWLISHLRKITLITINLVFNHQFVFSFIGYLNKKWNFLSTVFVAYPATEKYALAYVYPRHRHIMRWNPWPSGIFKQNGKWGLMTVISSIENDFNNPDNLNNLKLLVDRTEKMRRILNADQKSFAGILPGILYSKRILRKTVEADVTIKAVVLAEKQIRHQINYPDNTPLIILGGKGFIGRKLIKKLKSRKIYCVDANGCDTNLNAWPSHLNNQPAILINLTRKAVLSNYMHLFWKELVLLNETYPEPKKEEIKTLAQKNCSAFHVVGVKAKSYPSFPRAYRGGIPCCAARKTNDLQVIVYRLN